MNKDKPIVFISYATQDSLFALIVKLQLNARHIEVWMDKYNIDAGQEWRNEIDFGIDYSDVLVLILTPESCNSPYVTFEWAFALGHKKKVIPLLHKDSNIHPRLNDLQYLDFRNVGKGPWEDLCTQIEKTINDAKIERPPKLVYQLTEDDFKQLVTEGVKSALLNNSTTSTPRDEPSGAPDTTPLDKPLRPVTTTHHDDSSGLSDDLEGFNESKLPATRRSNDGVAIAPAIPMRLIKPFYVDVQAEAVNPGIAWGIKAVNADTSPFSGNGIVVAILDTGINSSHPAFSGINIVQKDFTGEGNGDKNGHGTHCAATVFGRDVDGTRIGVARGINKVLIGKVLDERGRGSSDMVVNAIQWAVDNGAHVISMSLAIDFPALVVKLEAEGLPTDTALNRALEGYRANVQLFGSLASFVQARGQGGFAQPCIIVAAAGNESIRNNKSTLEVAGSPPATSEGIISVAALAHGPNGLTVAYFSNTLPLISAPGAGILSANKDGGLTTLSGTSMATQYVAGVAAHWAEKLQSAGMLNSKLLTSRLIASGTTAGLQRDLDPFDIGSGLVQAPQA